MSPAFCVSIPHRQDLDHLLSAGITLRAVAVAELATRLHVVRRDRLWLCRRRKVERKLLCLPKALIQRKQRLLFMVHFLSPM